LINRHQASQGTLYTENMKDFSSMGNHLQMWQEVRLLKAFDYVLMRMKNRREATHNAAIQAYKSSTILYLAQSAVIALGIIGCWAITFAQSAVDEYGLSATLAISGLMLGIASPLQSLGFGESAITAAQGKSTTAWGLLEKSCESDIGTGIAGQAFGDAATTRLLQQIDSLLSASTTPSGIIWIKGPSGVGKTKLVEELVAHLTDNPHLYQQLNIAQLAQEPLLFHASGIENILVGRDPDYAQRAFRLMDSLALQKFTEFGSRHEDILDHDSINVSGGEKRRIALARALLDPESNLLVLDEPTDGLNRELRENVWALIRDRAASALVVVITHDAEAPATTSDLVVQL
jgi:ATP-binding cassette subfamily B protein